MGGGGGVDCCVSTRDLGNRLVGRVFKERDRGRVKLTTKKMEPLSFCFVMVMLFLFLAFF